MRSTFTQLLFEFTLFLYIFFNVFFGEDIGLVKVIIKSCGVDDVGGLSLGSKTNSPFAGIVFVRISCSEW